MSHHLNLASTNNGSLMCSEMTGLYQSIYSTGEKTSVSKNNHMQGHTESGTTVDAAQINPPQVKAFSAFPLNL